MPKYLLETVIASGGDGECVSLEWRLRAAAGELRRQGVAVVYDRAVPEPGQGRRCLFIVVAASQRVVRCVAELAQLGSFEIAEAGDRSVSVA